MAYVPVEDLSHGDSEELVKSLSKLNPEDACELASSPYPLVKSLLMSYLNSLTTYILNIPEGGRGKDVLDVVNINENDVVVIVGFIGPLVRELKGRVRKVFILERNPRRRGQALPDSAAPRVLGTASKVFITGATLVNDTLDSVLSMCRNAEVIALVGATASPHPLPLFKAGVNVVAGFRVLRNYIIDAVKVLRIGGGTAEVYRYGFKYSLTPAQILK